MNGSPPGELLGQNNSYTGYKCNIDGKYEPRACQYKWKPNQNKIGLNWIVSKTNYIMNQNSMMMMEIWLYNVILQLNV